MGQDISLHVKYAKKNQGRPRNTKNNPGEKARMVTWMAKPQRNVRTNQGKAARWVGAKPEAKINTKRGQG